MVGSTGERYAQEGDAIHNGNHQVSKHQIEGRCSRRR